MKHKRGRPVGKKKHVTMIFRLNNKFAEWVRRESFRQHCTRGELIERVALDSGASNPKKY